MSVEPASATVGGNVTLACHIENVIPGLVVVWYKHLHQEGTVDGEEPPSLPQQQKELAVNIAKIIDDPNTRLNLYTNQTTQQTIFLLTLSGKALKR